MRTICFICSCLTSKFPPFFKKKIRWQSPKFPPHFCTLYGCAKIKKISPPKVSTNDFFSPLPCPPHQVPIKCHARRGGEGGGGTQGGRRGGEGGASSWKCSLSGKKVPIWKILLMGWYLQQTLLPGPENAKHRCCDGSCCNDPNLLGKE